MDRADDQRPLGPRRHDADAAAPRRRATSRPRSPTFARRLARRAGRRPGRHRRPLRGAPRPRQRRAERRRRSPSTCATPTTPCCSEAERRLAAEVDRLAARRGRDGRRRARWPASSRSTSTRRPSTSSRRRPQRLGHSTRRMPSGAGHDAQMLARICPAAMIFTPSVGGLSHNIAEHTHPADVTAGADVLLQTLLALAGPSAEVARSARDRRARRRRRPRRQTMRPGRRTRSPRAASAAGTAIRSAGCAGGDRRRRPRRSPTAARSVTDAQASAGDRWAVSTISAAVSNGHARPERVERVLQVVGAGGDDDAGVEQRPHRGQRRAASPAGGRGPGGRGSSPAGRRRRCRRRPRPRRLAAGAPAAACRG